MRPRWFPVALAFLLLPACSRPLQTGESVSSSASRPLQLFQSSVRPALNPGNGPVTVGVTPQGHLRTGKPDAPLTLTIVTNHACEYCRTFERDLLPRLTKEFIEPGWLATETVILPIKKYQTSTLYAKSLLCGARQGSGTLLHEALFDLPSGDVKAVTAIAKKLHLDTTAFSTCLDAPETMQLITAQSGALLSQHITLVPSFILQGEVRTGLPDYADLRGWIEAVIRGHE